MRLVEIAKRLYRQANQTSVKDLYKKQARYFDEDGRYIPDPVPMAPPIGFKKQPSMVDIVRDMVKSERLAQEVAAGGFETFEESEDFDVDDEILAESPWENEYDPPVEELIAAGKEAIAKKRAQQAPPPAAPAEMDIEDVPGDKPLKRELGSAPPDPDEGG